MPHPQSGRITSIETQKRDPNRASVFIDGAFAFGIASDLVIELGLVPGDVIDADRLRNIVEANGLRDATETALRYLGHRARSEGEIRRRLARNDHDEAVIAQVMDRLRAWRYVDDEEFARRWIENRTIHRPRGTRLLRQELREKGIDRKTAESALADSEVDELAGAIRLARQRAPRLAGLDPAVRDRRLGAHLARRGFGYDVVSAAIKALEDEDG